MDPMKWYHALDLEAGRRWLLNFAQYTFPDYHIAKVHSFLAGHLEAFEEQVRKKKSPRLIITMPPRVGKSELTTRRYTAWLLGRNPDWNIGIVSYGAELAEELSADARRIVLSDEYRELFGDIYQPESSERVQIDTASKAVTHWRIAGRRGGVRAVGVGGPLTGRGFDVCIIDDPIKGREEADNEQVRDKLWKWFKGTLRTRIEPGGGIILIHTRWHHDDLTARLLEQRADRWQVLHLPALAEEGDILGRAVGEPLDPYRFTTAELADIRGDTDDREWFAQYQGQPTPDEGDLFKAHWFINEPTIQSSGLVAQYWDTAHGKRDARRKGDRSVCSTWRLERNTYRCIDLFVGRPSYPELKSLVSTLRDKHSARAVVIEDHSSGQSLIQDLRNATHLPILPWKTRNESKFVRADAVTPLWESGVARCSLPDQLFQELLREHMHFPNGKHDDIVDSCAMALAHMEVWNNKRRRQLIVRPFRVVA
jgi:Uncharacterized protein conserved in bacteria